MKYQRQISLERNPFIFVHNGTINSQPDNHTITLYQSGGTPSSEAKMAVFRRIYASPGLSE